MKKPSRFTCPDCGQKLNESIVNPTFYDTSHTRFILDCTRCHTCCSKDISWIGICGDQIFHEVFDEWYQKRKESLEDWLKEINERLEKIENWYKENRKNF